MLLLIILTSFSAKPQEGEGMQWNEDGISYLVYDWEGDSPYAHVTFKGNNYNSYSGYVVIPQSFDWGYGGEWTQCPVTAIGEDAFCDCPNLTGVSIPGSVYSIKRFGFYECPNLTQVVFREDGLESIETSAFLESGLSSITLPNTLQTIGQYAFLRSSNLKTVVLSSNLKSIGASAFADCPLTSITCPAPTPPTILNSTFSSSTYSTATLYVPASSLETYKAANYWKNFTNIKALNYDFVNNGIFYKKTGSNTVEVVRKSSTSYYSGNVTIPSSVTFNGTTYSVTGIGQLAFNNCSSLGTVTLPSTIKYISDRAFMYSNIARINIPSSVETIDTYAFYGCESLNYVGSVNGVKTINSFAFSHCSSLTSIVIPATVESLAGSTFNYNPSMTSISVNSVNNTHYVSQNGVVFTIDKKTLVAYPNGKGTSYTVPNGTEVIGTGAFRGSTILETVSFPMTLKTVESIAFCDNSSLASVSFPWGVTTIKNNAFQGCSSLVTVNLPSTLTYIGFDAFYFCDKLQNLIVKAKTPPTCQIQWDQYEEVYLYAFTQTQFNSTILTVPSGSKTAYKNASTWKNFANVQEAVFPDEQVGLSLDEALNADGGTIHFTSTGDYPWQSMSDGTIFYAQSSNGGIASTSSTMTAQISKNKASILSFDFKAWGEGTSTIYDRCVFSIDGVAQFTYGASQNDWSSFSVTIPAGSHTLTWSYTKDGSVNPTGDYFAVKNVKLSNTVPGDVDGDGKVGIDDITALIDILLNGTTAPADADVDGDGKVGIDDITALIDYLLNGN